ncbi:21132_t:CDS:10 [Entrophospora sp. SA101]|nr:21132_t:CDS:10 [Entrophospora sp. SA101]
MVSKSITGYNGGSVVAMVGKNCVAIASDKFLGVQLMTISTEFPKIFQATDKCYVGLPGLATDVQTLSERFRFKINMYKLREERDIEPKTLAHLVSSTLYEKRFGPYFVEPIVAGIDKHNQPYICEMDLIGCIGNATDFVVGGTSAENLYGICEALWEPDLPDDLFETISQALMNAIDRDCKSGWGAFVHVITPEKVITRTLKTRMSITGYNGGSVVAMVGKNCVAIASDKFLGVQLMTISTEFPKIFQATDKCYVGLPGLATDVQTLSERFRFKINMYKLREERDIEPKTLAHLVSSTLYEKRFGPYFVEPIVAGIDKHNQPYICEMDLIGCIGNATDFVVGGTSAENLYGICEALWEPDLPDDLFETISQALMNAIDRDCKSGWGAFVHVITPEKVITRTLKTRMD